MLASLLIDTAGWLGVAPRPADAAAVAGTMAVLGGAATIVRAEGAGHPEPRGAGWILLAVVAGAVLPVQGAINAQLRADLDAPITAALWSFIVATATMAGVLGALAARGRAPALRAVTLHSVPWWGWLGGLCGATYVTSVFLLIPHIGVASTVGLTVAGQQLASILVDRHGWLRLPLRAVTAARLAGVAVLLGGVALIQVG